MKRNHVFKLAIFLMIAAFFLAACGSGDAPPAEVVDVLTNVEVDQSADTAEDDVDDSGHEDSGDMDSDEVAGHDDDSDQAQEPVAPPPEPKAGLEATDPSTVMLASGSPQLVEFFAYW